MANRFLLLWRLCGVLVLLAIVTGRPAVAQAVVTITVPNGSFDGGVTGTCPNSWVCASGAPTVLGNAQWPAAGQVTGPAGSNTVWTVQQEFDVSYLTVANKQYATVTVPYCAASRSTLGSPQVQVRHLTGDGAQVGSTMVANFSNGDTSKAMHCSDGFAPDLVYGPIPANTEKLRVTLSAQSDYQAWQSVGAISISIAAGTVAVPGGGGTVGGGGTGGGGATLQYLYNLDGAILGTVQNNAATYLQQSCSNLSSISSVAGLVPDTWGGAGFGGQIAQILQGMRDLCEQQVQTETMGDIAGGILNPSGTPPIVPPGSVTVPTAGVPVADTLPEYTSAVQMHDDGGDDLVTAANRTNALLIANTQYQLAEMQKLRDAQEVTYSYQTQRGSRVTRANIDANEPNMEFAEGDYAGTYGRMNELADEAELEPDMNRRSQDDGVTLEAEQPACLLNTPEPTGEGWQYQAERARWNIRQRIMGTQVGGFLCEIVTVEASAGPLCLVDTIEPLQNVGMISQFMPAQICLEGPTAIDPVPLLFAMLSFAILLGGVMAAIAEFL